MASDAGLDSMDILVAESSAGTKTINQTKALRSSMDDRGYVER